MRNHGRLLRFRESGGRVPANPVVPRFRPVASNVTIDNTMPEVGDVLTVSYSFADQDGDDEGVSIISWKRDGAPIPGATIPGGVTYEVTEDDIGDRLSVGVIPMSVARPFAGSEALSAETENVPVPT